MFNTGLAEVSMTNSIVWGNTPDGVFDDLSYFVIGFCDMQEDQYAGIYGTVSVNPMFISEEDVRLQEGSPCIDAGNIGLFPADRFDVDHDGDIAEIMPLDADGNPRTVGDAVDMGAYESQY